MTVLDSKKLFSAIDKKMKEEKIPISKTIETIGISRTSYYRLKQGESVGMDTFLFIINWLMEAPEKFFMEVE